MDDAGQRKGLEQSVAQIGDRMNLGRKRDHLGSSPQAHRRNRRACPPRGLALPEPAQGSLASARAPPQPVTRELCPVPTTPPATFPGEAGSYILYARTWYVRGSGRPESENRTDLYFTPSVSHQKVMLLTGAFLNPEFSEGVWEDSDGTIAFIHSLHVTLSALVFARFLCVRLLCVPRADRHHRRVCFGALALPGGLRGATQRKGPPRWARVCLGVC